MRIIQEKRDKLCVDPLCKVVTFWDKSNSENFGTSQIQRILGQVKFRGGEYQRGGPHKPITDISWICQEKALGEGD